MPRLTARIPKRPAERWTSQRTEGAIFDAFYGGPKAPGRPPELPPRKVMAEIVARFGGGPSNHTLGRSLARLAELGVLTNAGSSRHPRYRRTSGRPRVQVLLEWKARREKEEDVRFVLDRLMLVPTWNRLPRKFAPLVERGWARKVKPQGAPSMFVGEDGDLYEVGIPGAYEVGPGTFGNLSMEDLHALRHHVQAIQRIWWNALVPLWRREEELVAQVYAESQGGIERDESKAGEYRQAATDSAQRFPRALIINPFSSWGGLLSGPEPVGRGVGAAILHEEARRSPSGRKIEAQVRSFGRSMKKGKAQPDEGRLTT